MSVSTPNQVSSHNPETGGVPGSSRDARDNAFAARIAASDIASADPTTMFGFSVSLGISCDC